MERNDEVVWNGENVDEVIRVVGGYCAVVVEDDIVILDVPGEYVLPSADIGDSVVRRDGGRPYVVHRNRTNAR